MIHSIIISVKPTKPKTKPKKKRKEKRKCMTVIFERNVIIEI